MAIVSLFYFLFMMAFYVGLFVLVGFGPYTMAKNAGIHNPWLAFLPFGNTWIICLLGERARYFHTGKTTPLAKTALFLQVGAIVVVLLMLVAFLVSPALTVILYFAFFAALIASAVYTYIAIYNIFRDYSPGNETAFLLLSIFLEASFILFIIYRNVVPVSVTGYGHYTQPKYNAPPPPPNYGSGGYGSGGYAPPPEGYYSSGEYGQNPEGYYNPGGDSQNPGVQGYDPPHSNEDYRGPEL